MTFIILLSIFWNVLVIYLLKNQYCKHTSRLSFIIVVWIHLSIFVVLFLQVKYYLQPIIWITTLAVRHDWNLEIISTWRPVVQSVCESAVKLCYYLEFLVIILVFKWKVCALMQWFSYHGFGFTPAFSCRRGTCCLYMAPHFRSWLGKEIVYFIIV